MRTSFVRLCCAAAALLTAAGCSDDTTVTDSPVNPDTAPVASIDRFSTASATLMVRTAANGMPASNAAIDFDTGPFITRGFGPAGQRVSYYNFDVRPTTPAPIYVLFPEGGEAPVPGQLNIIDAIPGEAAYNDFWQVVRVDVPAGYIANTITSRQTIVDRGLAMTTTDTLVNCPVVPAGSTARKRVGGGSAALNRGWYRGQLVHYFSFDERVLKTASGSVPLSPIFVTFNVNPDQPNGGPPSGFRTEAPMGPTHNVLGALPGDAGYSPLWTVNVYDNAAFSGVSNLTTAQAAPVLARGVATVNCPLADMN